MSHAPVPTTYRPTTAHPAHPIRRRLVRATVPAAVVAGLLLTLAPSQATTLPGTPARDVQIGPDDDVATNPLLAPVSGVRQDLGGTDVLFGRAEDDLLIGNRGDDVLLGGPGSDVSVGGPDAGSTGRDVSIGDTGDDVHVWSPGDGNDTVSGNEGDDTLLVGRVALDATGHVVLATVGGRQLPRVGAAGVTGITCRVDVVPTSSGLGSQQLVRITTAGRAATVRDRDVEQVVCPSATPDRVLVARPFSAAPAFVEVSTSSLSPLLRWLVTP